MLINSIVELNRWRNSIHGRVGLVPTMGALHEGHATLLRKIRPRCDFSVLSVFVNPTQFGPLEDLAKYPRTLEQDIRVAEKEGVDIVFAPTPQEMYPSGYSTYVEETRLELPLCGQVRPGHFRGVTTIVLKLFNLVRPQLALFGLKDAQQFFVLNKMVQDLNLDLRIEGVSTVREIDGLALSSRNIYLTPDERKRAPLIYQTLQNLRQSSVSAQSLRAAQEGLEAHGFQVQYLERLALPDLSTPPLTSIDSSAPSLIAIAARLGNTRLIDNVIQNPERLESLGIYTI